MSQTRLGKRFAALKEQGQSAFVTFVSAGDPDPETSAALLSGFVDKGVDVLEIGMPFSDPMADGLAIQLGSQRALAKGMTLRGTLQMVRDFRNTNQETPIVLMGYYNPIYSYGVDQFLADAKDAGVDGFIIVDLPPEEENEFAKPCHDVGLDFIYLTTPTADDARLKMIAERASGFIYYVSVTGVTGTKSAEQSDVAHAVKRIKQFTDLPVAIGFGINTPDQARSMAAVADGAVVGSAIVKKIEAGVDANGNATPTLVSDVLDYVGTLAEGVHHTNA